MFRKIVEDFNINRRQVLDLLLWLVFDESMSNFQPRTSQTGGLPNLSFIKRKPKPLGTEFKVVVDGASGMMVSLEIQ